MATRAGFSTADMLRSGASGLTSRRTRTILSIIGVAMGIAALVAVLGISQSNRADLINTLDRLGTNLLSVQPGTGIFGQDASLPETAPAMIRRIPPVEDVARVGSVDATVRRNELVPRSETGGIGVRAADTNLLSALGGSLAEGRFVDAASGRLPTVVLGADAATSLGISRTGVEVVIGAQRHEVIGILAPLDLGAELDRTAIVGFDWARTGLLDDGKASAIYVRSDPDHVEDVRSVLATTANPTTPGDVQVSRPSDAIEARVAAKNAYQSLFLGLGAVALLVGGIGIANVMVIGVLERRSEIGLRRALGARRRHIRGQFLTEALILAVAGGILGALVGALVTFGYGAIVGHALVVPLAAAVLGVGAALLIGAVAGLYPAMRAARLSPTEALRTA